MTSFLVCFIIVCSFTRFIICNILRNIENILTTGENQKRIMGSIG
jgi:hypothetical protein